MDATWATVTWSPPNLVSLEYPVITYEIGYQQSNDICQESINVLATNLTNVSSTSFNITGLTPDTRYAFTVRAYTINGHGEWSVVTNETLAATIFITGKDDYALNCVSYAHTIIIQWIDVWFQQRIY